MITALEKLSFEEIDALEEILNGMQSHALAYFGLISLPTKAANSIVIAALEGVRREKEKREIEHRDVRAGLHDVNANPEEESEEDEDEGGSESDESYARINGFVEGEDE